MKFKVLSSGSKGNCTYFQVNNKNYLIDLGVSTNYLVDKLKVIDVSPNSIDGIFLTHIHSDHTLGLQRFIKKYHTPIYLSKDMYDHLKDKLEIAHIVEEDFALEDLNIKIIKTSHDVDSYGYIFETNNSSLVYITDTGYLNERYIPELKDRSAYIFESNHDDEMLNNGSYPFYLKQRIRGPKGHLSNYDSSQSLSKMIGEHTKVIVLAHLSEENNTEELAYNTLVNTLKKKEIDFKNILIAKQNEDLELIEL